MLLRNAMKVSIFCKKFLFPLKCPQEAWIEEGCPEMVLFGKIMLE
jgi:hypothetical protein